MNEGGNRRFSLSIKEMPVEKKMKTSSVAREGLPAIERPVIGLTSSIGKKNEAVRSEPVMPAMPKMGSTIVDRIA
ncbi:hypothetical protein ACFXTI_009007 [Malus domestica]